MIFQSDSVAEHQSKCLFIASHFCGYLKRESLKVVKVLGEKKAVKQPRFYRLGLWGIGTAEWKGFLLFVLSFMSHLVVIKGTECLLARRPSAPSVLGGAAELPEGDLPLPLTFWEGAVGLEPGGSSLGRGPRPYWWAASQAGRQLGTPGGFFFFWLGKFQEYAGKK